MRLINGKQLNIVELPMQDEIVYEEQRDDQKLEKDKYEKGPKNPRIENDQVMEHERTIWAGTKMDLNNKSKDVKNIPDAVLTSFRQFFPNQQIDNVRKYRGLYAITF